MKKESNPKVTVVIPSYNHEEFIKECIDSVLSQTFQDFEIVITDDCSTDGTVEEIKKIKDPRVRLFVNEKNKGASVAVNNSIREARGEYIAQLNSDDVFLPEKLEKQVLFLDNNPDVGVVFTYAGFIDDDSNPYCGKSRYLTRNIFVAENRSRHEWLRYFFDGYNCLCHPSSLVRKKCFEEVGFYEERFAQIFDIDFWIRLCKAYEIHVIKEPLMDFRLRANKKNASSSTFDANNRHAFEGVHLLDNFINMTDSTDLLKVFPEITKYGEPNDADMVPYLISRVIIDGVASIKKPLRYSYALNAIYEMLGDDKKREKLLKYYNFDYPEFIKLSGKKELFRGRKKEKKRFKWFSGKLLSKNKN